MEYSEYLKSRVLESRHSFIYGEKKERSTYLKALASSSYLDNDKKTIPIYTDFPGFKEVENKDCEQLRLKSFQGTYFEIYITSLMFEKLKTELNEEELTKLEVNLKNLFYEDSIRNFNLLQKELEIGKEAYKELYEHYIMTGKLKSELLDDVKIIYVLFDMLLPNIKMLVPSFSEFILIIDKVCDFSLIYTQIINTYVASRSNNYLSIKIGCENNNDWRNYSSINGEFIEYVHDYDIIEMNTYKLNRSKKE